MIRTRLLAKAALLALMGQGLAATAWAQAPGGPAQEPPWVQYELIAFRPVEPLPSDETWPAEPLPDYPPQIGFLLEAGTPAHEAALRAREFEQSLQAEAGTAAAPVDALTEELPRLRLAGADTLLAAAAERIGNAREYRLLGHYAWRQPLPAPGQAEHLLITGGATSGGHFELEGYLTLSRSRFLHVEATLWLSDLLPPGAPPDDGAVVLPALPEPQLPAETPALAAQGTPSLDSPASEAPGLEGLPAVADPQAPAVEPQRALISTLLRANRRLAGNSIHYVDHPRLGLILTARPWDPAAPPLAAEEPAPPEPAQASP